MRDWEAIRRRYVNEKVSLRQLARETGISYSTLTKRARQENWQDRKGELLELENGMRLERLTQKLLDQIEAALSAEEGMEAKDFKAVTGALRELKEMRGEKQTRTGAGELTVRFVGEAEEYSR